MEVGCGDPSPETCHSLTTSTHLNPSVWLPRNFNLIRLTALVLRVHINMPSAAFHQGASTIRQVDRQSALAGLFVFLVHVTAGVAHRCDAVVERHEMLTITTQR